MIYPWHQLTRPEANELYSQVLADNDTEAMIELCCHDLFFLLTVATRRADMDRDWLYERVREVEADPNGNLDVWAREHYKSTIITFGLTIQDILNDAEITFGIFSHTRPIAKSFLKQIKTELESNTFLQNLFPDILYKCPDRESPSWSMDNGITVKRKTNPAAATVEAWGLVDGMPTGKHFRRLVYDDVVTLTSVSTPEQIQKTTDAWALSLSLGATGGEIRYIGTYYHTKDTWKEIELRGAAKVRKHPGTQNGKEDGIPVLWTAETMKQKRKQMGLYVFACQILLTPVSEANQTLREEWLRFYEHGIEIDGMNIYIIVDAANAKKKNSDYTVISVIGLGADNNYYRIFAIRDRMNLVERTRLLFSLHRKYQPRAVGYEEYGMMADIQHIQYVQERTNYRFQIIPLAGSMSKHDRIKRLVPIYESGRWWNPRRLVYRDVQQRERDFMEEFIHEEYLSHPVGSHDDMLDCDARILDEDLGAVFPAIDRSSYAHGTFGDEMPEGTATTNHKYDVLAGIGKN